jgi:uncharacterized membrane protein YgcG
MMQLIYLLVVAAAVSFWLIQVLDLLFRDLRFFESHTHKLIWFLVLVSGNIVGAVWYYIWKRQTIVAMSVPGRR